MLGRNTLEILRRVALLAGLLGAICLAYLTRFEPMVRVSMDKPDSTGRFVAATDLGEGRVQARDLVRVSGPQWDSLFAGASRSFAENVPIPGWEHRITARDLATARKDNAERHAMNAAAKADEADRVKRLKEKYNVDVTFTGSFHRLYFAASEAPFRDAAPKWTPGTSHVLLRDADDRTRLDVFYNSAYRIHGFSDVITIPAAFSYPYRHLAPWVALAGLLLYFLLPWGRIGENVVAYTRWRLILGDVATSGLLVVPFFGIPIAVIGGTMETVVEFWPFALLFWLLAALGVAGTLWSVSASAYRLAVGPDALVVSGLSGEVVIPYDQVRTVQAVRLRPPQWLITVSWLTALLGRNSTATAGQVGRSLLLGASAANGLRLDLRNGAHHYIWFSDQMGNTSMQHFERLGQALHRDGIQWGDDPVEIRAVFPPSH